MPNNSTEIAIVGGGICGLWLLNALRDQGYQASLFERDQLGTGQTLASQGMIHGGIKYTLGGFTSAASETIANMPNVWRDCIAGKGPLDLSGLEVLSDDYFLFSDGALSSRVTAFFASKSLRGRIDAVKKGDYPEVFNNKAFKGQLYKLQDIVINTGALIEHLQARHSNHIFQATVELKFQGDDPILTLDDGSTLEADHIILAAGQGNEQLIAQVPTVSMQRRPLKQVMVKGPLPPVYAHAVSLKDAAKPRLTITTHPLSDGENVWYLGGNLAELGVGMSDDDLVRNAKQELKELLPWIETQELEYRTLEIDRAEPTQDSGARPDNPYVNVTGKVITCWPTKLTLTPLLASEVLECLPPPSQQTYGSLQLPLAKRSPYPWELAFA